MNEFAVDLIAGSFRGDFFQQEGIFGSRPAWPKKHPPDDSKWPFHPLVGSHLTIEKGHLTIPKRSQRIARQTNFTSFTTSVSCDPLHPLRFPSLVDGKLGYSGPQGGWKHPLSSLTWLAGKSQCFNRNYIDSFMVEFPAIVMSGTSGGWGQLTTNSCKSSAPDSHWG